MGRREESIGPPSWMVWACVVALYAFGLVGFVRVARSGSATTELRGWSLACLLLGIPVPILQIVPGIAGCVVRG